MAGIGKRFLDGGYGDPKPLIRVHGKPMIEYIVNLFPGEDNFVFICNQKHLEETELERVLMDLKPRARVIGISDYQQGPLANILFSAASISDTESIMVSYCDFAMTWDYADFKKTVATLNPDSASICYRGFHPHLLGPNLYAGVLADDHRWACEVKEKFSFTSNKMDTWQQAGVFYFRSGSLLKKYAAITCASSIKLNGEYYVSHIFNPLLNAGKNSLVYPIDYFCQWGTPEDLHSYTNWIELARSQTDSSIACQAIIQTFSDRNIPIMQADAQAVLSYWNSFLQTSHILSS